MKKILSTLLLSAALMGLYAQQAPQAFNYQAVARQSSGSPITNGGIGVKLSILDGSPTGPVEYAETQAATTNNMGLFNLAIGQGTAVTGTFANVVWGSSAKYLKVEMDPTGGSNYTLSGTSPLLSVPYALYAEKTLITAGNGISVSGNTVTNAGDLSNTNELQTLDLVGNTLSISNGNSVVLPNGGGNYTAGNGINVTGTIISNTGDLSPTNEFQTLSLTGSTLSLTNGNSVILPVGTTYTAGTGINIAGTVINNTGDLSTINEIQSLSLSGNMLTISGSNSVTLPAGTTYNAGTGISIVGTTINNTAPDQIVSLTAGVGIGVAGTYPNFTVSNTGGGATYTAGAGIGIAGTVITNTAPDQIVTLNAGAGIGVTGTYPNFTVTNTGGGAVYTAGIGIGITGNVIDNLAPDQIVTLTAGAGIGVTGTYPNFTVTNTGGGVTYTAGTGISIAGTVITNTAPDQIVSLTAGANIAVAGAYPNFTITGTGGGGGTNYWTLSGTNIYNNNAGNVGIETATPQSKLDVTTATYGLNDAIITSTYSGVAAYDAVGLLSTSAPQDFYGYGGILQGGFQGAVGAVFPTGANDYLGVHGLVSGGTGNNYGVYGNADGGGINYGVYGLSDNNGVAGFNIDGVGLVYAEDPYANLVSAAIYGNAQGITASDMTTGLMATATATGELFSMGVYGIGAGATNNNYGVYGYTNGDGFNSYAIAIYGDVGTTGSLFGDYAGYFNGDLETSGFLTKAGGTFKIDHPLDPANKYLYHSFVESPDMMNIYNGNATTDANGMAVISLPSYFEAENIDFKYQLTCMGQFAQAIVKEEVANNQFTVQTDKPNVKVSWQVTGVRNDKWAQSRRVVAEVEKKGPEKGRYLHPELFGQARSQSIGTLIGAGINSTNLPTKQAAKQTAMPVYKK